MKLAFPRRCFFLFSKIQIKLNLLSLFPWQRTDHPSFRIDSESGSIRTLTLLDRETIEKYTIEVLAIDQGTPQLNGTATVIITLNDVQDSHPVFTQKVYNFTIDENSLYDVGTIKATLADKDFRDALDYRITSHSNKLVSSPFSLTISSSHWLREVYFYIFKVFSFISKQLKQ